MNLDEASTGISLDKRLPPSGRNIQDGPPVCLWKSLCLQQMTHRGNCCVVLLCCCSAVANIRLSFLLHFGFYDFFCFSKSSSVS